MLFVFPYFFGYFRNSHKGPSTSERIAKLEQLVKDQATALSVAEAKVSATEAKVGLIDRTAAELTSKLKTAEGHIAKLQKQVCS